MMLNIKASEISENVLNYIPVGLLIGLIFIFEVFLVVENDFISLIPLTSALQSISKINFLVYSFLITVFNYQDSNTICEIINHSEKIFEEGIINPGFIQWINTWESYSNIEVLGFLIYTYYFPYFLLASLILLIAMIGAIVLTLHKNTSVRNQKIFKQNIREFTKTIQKLQS